MTLQILWFVLIAVLFLGYFLLEGFDFGVGVLSPFLYYDDVEEVSEKKRRVVLNTIDRSGTVMKCGSSLLVVPSFASFPGVDATQWLICTSHSLALIVRNVAIEFRSKIHTKKWR